MTAPTPEPWLRGPVAGVSALLQPAAHALIMAREDVHVAVRGLDPEWLWRRIGAAPSVGFHLLHLSGSTDRLLTYARGEALSEGQMDQLARERALPDGTGAVAAARPGLEALLSEWELTVDAALDQLRTTDEASLLEARKVGRAGLPSTVLGLVFHAAEHAARHTGQIVTTARILAGREGA